MGKTRAYNDALQVTAFDVSPIADHNEVTYHLLNCIQVHLKNTTKAPDPQPSSANPGFSYGACPTAPAEAPKPMLDANMPGDLNPTQSQVLAIIAENSLSEEG